MVRLDDALADLPVAYVKVDVEGYEEEVARGATALLRRAEPAVWQWEVNEASRDYGRGREGLRRLLLEHGYRFFTFNPRTRELRESGAGDPAEDVLAIRDPDRVRARIAGDA